MTGDSTFETTDREPEGRETSNDSLMKGDDSAETRTESEEKSHDKHVASAQPKAVATSPETATKSIGGWPPKPASLRKHGFGHYFGLIVDFATVIVVFPFLVLAGAAAVLNGKIAPPHQWSTIYSAMNATVTIFPIVFTAIVARTIKAFATWKFERGTTLGLLEQLLASQSLFGALQTLWALRVLNIAGVVLVALAAISPIGGQSSLQMLKIRDRAELSQPVLSYLTTGQKAWSWFESGDYFWYALPSLNAMYSSSLMAPASVKTSTMDLWGNVKIPYLSRLGSVATSTGWQDVPMDQDVLYSSLIGIPVSGLSRSSNSSFTMETSYFDLDCYRLTNGTWINATVPEVATKGSPNGTFYGIAGSTYSIAIDYIVEMSYGSVYDYVSESNQKTETHPQATLLFQSMAGYESGFTRAYCHISTEYVEVAINCTGLACGVNSMRPSQNAHPDPRLVPFEFGYYFNGFGWQFPLATSSQAQTAETSSATEFYLNNPLNPFANSYRLVVNLYELSRDDMSIRLGQVLNSYYLGSLAPFTITGLTVGTGTGESEGGPADEPGNNTVAALASVNNVRYVCQWGWWTIFVLSCILMLITASIGAVLRWNTSSPDILGSISSMTRDSPYVELPEGGSTLGGTDRTRILKELKVQLRDVRERDDVGRLAFGSVDKAEGPPRADRMYE
ncbi:uncharacterized protein PV07_03050 [Cladophialophora immunda]|uniref:Uncharacterized protein n=1 Tax=Cladophialophora immunda TaxID=569365 RepID=A0A0D2D6R9_9EURO|nr:uncharacterized protein PV07_03050 [Cladophialophora immunda]KIW31399.1 hypothetical protein PV07_03050 [Cladophialophora immunda]